MPRPDGGVPECSPPRRATARAAPRARIRLPCGPAVRSAAGGLQPRPLPCPSCDGDAMWSLARRSFLALAVSLSWDVGSRRQTALTMRKAIRPPRGPRPPRGRGWLRGGPAAHSCAVSHPRGHPGVGSAGRGRPHARPAGQGRLPGRRRKEPPAHGSEQWTLGPSRSQRPDAKTQESARHSAASAPGPSPAPRGAGRPRWRGLVATSPGSLLSPRGLPACLLSGTRGAGFRAHGDPG